MPGIRIHHPTHRNCVMLVPHPGEIKRGFKKINKGRAPKDYRITLDSEGNSIVSETVWQRLVEAGSNFLVLNEVLDPPKQTMSSKKGNVYHPAVYKEVKDAVLEIAPAGVTAFKVKRHK